MSTLLGKLRKSSITLSIILLLLGLLYTVILWRSQPLPAQGPEATEDGFSATIAFKLLTEILVEELPHPTGSPLNQRIRQRIVDHLAAIGYTPEIQATKGCSRWNMRCLDVENVIATLPGTTNGPSVLLVAHYDSVRTGPGIADDGAGVVTVLEVARILKNEAPFQNPIYFLLTDGEEAGLIGAQTFVDNHDLAQNVSLVINIEARGTSGPSIMFETSEGNGWLIEQFAQAAPRPTASSLFFEVYKLLPNDTDLTVFKEAGMAGYGFAFGDDVENYHTPNDNLANLNLDSLQHHGENALQLARHLANADLTQARTGNVIYHDISSLFIVRAPIWLGQILGVILCILLMGLIFVSRLRNHASNCGLFVSILFVLTCLGLPVVLAALPELLGEGQPFWSAIPLPRLTVTLGILLLAFGLSAILPANVRSLELSLATWAIWGFISLALLFFVPGASVIFLVPAMCAVTLHLILLGKPAWQLAVIALSTFCTAIIWFKLIWLFDMALSIQVGPGIIAIPLAIFATTLLPLLHCALRDNYSVIGANNVITANNT